MAIWNQRRLSRTDVERYRQELERRRAALLAERTSDSKGTDDPALDEIDRALAAIANGSYGICAECGEPIDVLRLNMVPEIRSCLLCAFP